MLSRTIDWLKERWPLSAISYWSFHEEIPGGASYAYTFGSSLLFVFLIQVVTGAWELFFYVPTVDHAYESLGYLRTQVPFGWLIHNLHYWGSNAFVVLVALHLSRVFIWGAHKPPRQLTWLIGSVLLLLTAGITFTGAVLAWDELGYWAAEVGTSILGTVPLVGDFLQRVMRGGSLMGQLALSRFFAWHVVVFAGLLAAFILIHLVAFRQFGSVGPWDPGKARKIGWFWPDQILKDLVVISVLFVILIALAAFVPAPITGPADPVDTTYSPKPEWNFLFLYQALKAFPGRWEPVGTVLLPLLLVFFLFAMPFLDRRPERRPRQRPFALAAAFVVAAGIITLTLLGYYTAPAEFTLPPGQRAAAAARAVPSRVPSPAGREGEKLFLAQGCLACHVVNGKGGTAGPDLSAEGAKGRTRDWLATQLRTPAAHHPGTIMPSYGSLSDTQISGLVDYLESLQTRSAAPGGPAPAPAAALHQASQLPPSGQQGPPGPALEMIGSPPHGAVLYSQSCKACHGPEGMGKLPNPGSTAGTVPPMKPIAPTLFSADPHAFAANVDRYIQHGSKPAGPQPALAMPAFGETNTLTQPEIANIEAYVLRLNGVDRAQIQHPGVVPWLFFAISAGAFGLLWLGLGLWWLRVRGPGGEGRPAGPDSPAGAP